MLHAWIGTGFLVAGALLFLWAVRIRWRNWDDWATSMVINNIAFALGLAGCVELIIWWVAV